MSVSRRSIFRSAALEQYRQSKRKDILPRFVSPPLLFLLWLLLGLLLSGIVVVCLLLFPGLSL